MKAMRVAMPSLQSVGLSCRTPLRVFPTGPTWRASAATKHVSTFAKVPVTARRPASTASSKRFASSPARGQPAGNSWAWGVAAFTGLAVAGSLGLVSLLWITAEGPFREHVQYFGASRRDSIAREALKAGGAHKLDANYYQRVYDAIAESLEEDAIDYDDGSYGPVLVRLAWHASGTYDKTTNNGGSNGATMRFAPEADHGANAGLLAARNKLEPIKQRFPDISYSDLWTLAGVCAIQEMGGPKIAWRPGRQDGFVENCSPDGVLPDADKGASHLRDIFHRMSMTDQEIVALSGAHALGRCHTDRSGFTGPWTFSPTSFSNEYFRLLFDEKWQMKKWKGPAQFEDVKTKSLMMLKTDMAIIQDKGFRQYAELYAKDQERFFEDFSKAFAKLIELGVPARLFEGKDYLTLKATGD